MLQSETAVGCCPRYVLTDQICTSNARLSMDNLVAMCVEVAMLKHAQVLHKAAESYPW